MRILADVVNDYVQSNSVSTILSVTRDGVISSVKFIPKVLAGVGDNKELCVLRQELLLEADSIDDTAAQVEVNRLYADFVA